MDAKRLAHYIAVEMQRVGGRGYHLTAADLEPLGIEKLRELKRFVEDAKNAIRNNSRTMRFWPGGPSIRI
ncbi:MAG: hypothetical protein ACYTBS_08560 [Planctomycetota bacterium]|jgi:hypothetical protein